jgi:hypothetical protein
MPKNLQKITTLAAETVNVTHMRIALQRLLDLQSQAVLAPAHVGRPSRQPDPHTRGDRDHLRNAPSTRRNAGVPTSRPTRSVVPSRRVISIAASPTTCCRRDEDDLLAGVGSGGGTSHITCTGRNCRSACDLSVPARTWRRQFHNRPRLTSCRRATSAKQAHPDASDYAHHRGDVSQLAIACDGRSAAEPA